MGHIWGRQDPGGPRVGLMNFAIWDISKHYETIYLSIKQTLLIHLLYPACCNTGLNCVADHFILMDYSRACILKFHSTGKMGVLSTQPNAECSNLIYLAQSVCLKAIVKTLSKSSVINWKYTLMKCVI